MVPWPIALIAIWYGMMSAASGAMLWKIAIGLLERSIIWPGMWFALSLSTMCGLALMKPWARVLAVVGAAVFTIVCLAMAGLLVMAGRPFGGFVATLAAGVQVVVMRYLRRPHVKTYFAKMKVGNW